MNKQKEINRQLNITKVLTEPTTVYSNLLYTLWALDT